MEFAASILGSMATAAGGAGATGIGMALGNTAGAISGAAGTVGSAIGGASLVGSILSGSASLLQMSALRRAGREKEQELNLAAQDTRTDIAQENIQATNRSNSLKQALLDTIGERDAAYAASGIDIGFGTPAQARQEATATAESALTQDQAGATSRVSRLNERAQQLQIMARRARQSADETADFTGLGAVGKLLARG